MITFDNTKSYNFEMIRKRSYAYNLTYSLGWFTKNKSNLLNHNMALEIENCLFEIAKKNSYEIIFLSIEENFVFLIISAKPKNSVTEIIKNIKGTTGKRLIKKFEENSVDSIEHVWDSFYFSKTIDSITKQSIKQQISLFKDM